MHELILIVDYGSQYTQLIARRIRERHVFCRIVPPRELTPKALKRQHILLLGLIQLRIIGDASDRPDHTGELSPLDWRHPDPDELALLGAQHDRSISIRSFC